MSSAKQLRYEARVAERPAEPCAGCGAARFGRVRSAYCRPCGVKASGGRKPVPKLAAKHTGRRTAYKFSGKSHAPYTRADDAARFLRPWGPMLKVDDGWQWGSLRLTDADVIARATRKGWKAPEGLG